MRVGRWALALLILLASPGLATIGEAVPASVLIERCQVFAQEPGDLDGELCDAYIRGFLGGIRTEGRIRGAAGRAEETFVERAARTRLGWILPRPRYCIPHNLSMDSFVEQFLYYASARDASDIAAEELLRHLLNFAYRCDR